jgi:hypothetical protein
VIFTVERWVELSQNQLHRVKSQSESCYRARSEYHPSTIRAGGRRGGVEVDLRSLVCAVKVDLINSDFDPDHATGQVVVQQWKGHAVL